MSAFIPGQRWISESEPELGLGTIVQTGRDRVQVEFKTAGETRTYAAEQAPLRRVRFGVGDKVRTQDEHEFIVRRVIEQQSLLVYVGENQQLPEAQLSDRVSLRGPQDRLFAGHFDPSATFLLRRRTLEMLNRSRRSPVRGFVGGRIDLLPHQLYIAQEVANRHAPRVMLSDEVGLGKTIEACLILHRLLLSGRADRIFGSSARIPSFTSGSWKCFGASTCGCIFLTKSAARPSEQLANLASIRFSMIQLVLTSL